MELSDWMRQMLCQPQQTILNQTKTFKVYPISSFKCCDNPVRITSNDGNKTQKCANCNWELTH